ncbi:efflux RND transporter periplasmic adaptor subunit [Bradyrhizobium cenepequi]|uniref:efflux RND transporter periplasmic adaptor subunit n=1 Tax=Bradyrhizobium cenepequi TaxID=2821403 RepID=UPI001CE3787A|nr:efflux RND transporter periplasmic adaptor subunit [Bradyrhizobium cenepequi]MCA6109431.1 efflux RND transporter periplasmic adaptor subunit [Bradyrhizobium cenepequi]
MTRAIVIGAAAASFAAAGIAIFAGVIPWPKPAGYAVSHVAAAGGGAPIYYQHPDGKPFYSLTPKTTEDGRDYHAVPAGADISFDDAPQPAPTESAEAKGSRKTKYYRNPMGLPDTSPTPKKDSMGMDYIPVYEGEDSDDGSIRLSPGRIQRTGVKSEPVMLHIVSTLVRAPGTIQFDERRVSVIAMRAESYVQKVADVTTGSRVAKGQPLMEIYSPAVSSAAAEYLSTITSKATATIETYGRGSRQRLMNLDVPESAITTLEKTRTVPIVIQWSAPRDGIVLERNAVEGMRAQPGDVLFRVADTSLVWAVVDVAERDIGGITVGQPVTVRARGFPGRAFTGKVSVIYPQMNRETRTVRLRIELDNADLALLPDMYVDAEIEVGSQDPVLAVPDSSVLDTGSRQTVIIDKRGGRFEPREVKVGHRGGGYVEITEGVSEDDTVVTSANFLIDAESNLKAALKGFSAAGSAPDTSSTSGTGGRP